MLDFGRIAAPIGVPPYGSRTGPADDGSRAVERQLVGGNQVPVNIHEGLVVEHLSSTRAGLIAVAQVRLLNVRIVCHDFPPYKCPVIRVAIGGVAGKSMALLEALRLSTVCKRQLVAGGLAVRAH